ncbi:MAG: DUF3795 domain-containing protein [Dehalococcoidia bacterium]|nr:DUF3795 domain-containing protein [Dehalococcoidia bacterium]
MEDVTGPSLAEDPVKYVGCCGAWCRTCKPFVKGFCKGCKLGYQNGERDIAKARCAIKVCCLSRGYESCADCPDLEGCPIVGVFHNKTGYKYGKYRQSTQFLRHHGYAEFIRQADNWTGAYGKLQQPE